MIEKVTGVEGTNDNTSWWKHQKIFSYASASGLLFVVAVIVFVLLFLLIRGQLQLWPFASEAERRMHVLEKLQPAESARAPLSERHDKLETLTSIDQKNTPAPGEFEKFNTLRKLKR